MRVILFCLAIVASSSAGPRGQQADGSRVSPDLGYHDAVGIPNAARIKEMEDQYFADKDSEIQDPRIVGGAVAPSNAHPYLAGLIISFVNIAGNSVCGSSILSPNRLVTAAHCWWDGQNLARQFEVVLGSQWLFSGGTRIVTTQVVMHGEWNPATLANDVAMIYLPWTVPFTAAIQPIALPSTTQLWDTFVGEWGIAAGYGRTSDAQTGVTTSTAVSQVRLQVISVAQCQASFGTWAQASNICTSGLGGVGICGGDSGGPLAVNRNGQNILKGTDSLSRRDIADVPTCANCAGLIISFVNIAGNSVCGSSILSPNRLVTAAHCWWDGQNLARQFEVVLGSQWLFSGGTRIVTTQVVMHAEWNPTTLANDVAMIYLAWTVPFTAAIQPIALPSTTQLWDTFVGEWGIAAGYGRTSDAQTGVTTSTAVSQVRLQVISVAQCQASFGTWAQASNICTSGLGGVGICGGDSGGPLAVNRNGQNILIGISSFVARNGCQLSHPSAFARVTSFFNFIISHL